MAIHKTTYVKLPGQRNYKKHSHRVITDRNFRSVCDEQYNFFERGKNNKPKVEYSNFGTKRTAVTTHENGGKYKVVIEEKLIEKGRKK